MNEARKKETARRREPDQHETRSVAFAYDGSAEGLMSCVFHSYAYHVIPQDIARKDMVQPRLDQDIVDIPTNIDQAFRVRRGIVRCGGYQVWKDCLYTAASDDPKAPYAAFQFIRQLFDVNACVCRTCKRRNGCRRPCAKNEGPHILDEWATPHVEDVLKTSRSVANEINRMHELIRFSHLASDIWFARCNPNANVVPFLMSWFAPRFNTQRFMIWDEVHHVAGMSEDGKSQVARIDDIDALLPQTPSDEEAKFEDAWRRFYRAVSIDARYHPELRRHFMPMRLWKNITELSEEGRPRNRMRG